MAERPRTGFSTMLSGILSKAELILLGVLALGIILKYMGKTADQAFMISLSGLAGVFFLTAFLRPRQPEDSGEPDEEPKKGLVVTLLGNAPKIAGIGNAVCAIGVLFFLLHLAGAREQLMIGIAGAGFGAFLILLLQVMGGERAKALIPILYRSIPLLAVSVYMFSLLGNQ